MSVVAPRELIQSGSAGVPRPLRLTPHLASEIAATTTGLQQIGPDMEVDSFAPLSALSDRAPSDGRPGAGTVLTYLSSVKFARGLQGRRDLVVLTTPQLRDLAGEANTLLITSDDPRNVFYSLLEHAVGAGWFERLESFRSPSAVIAPSAVVEPHVYVDEDAVIGPGAVLLSNTYIGPGAVVRPNAVVGGNGYEGAIVGGRRRIVKHAGGVWLSEGVHIGSCTCIEKGLFGDFTFVGSQTLIDNLVQFSHGVRAGRNCSITAGAVIAGSTRIGNGVWIGPNASINQGLQIGDCCFIGTGCVVTNHLRAHRLAYGGPAKGFAKVCSCRQRLFFEEGQATCEVCGKQYTLVDGKVQQQ